MNISTQTAKHLREVFFGGNWTASDLKQQLEDITWQQANISVYDFNNIAALVYHIHYFIGAVIPVLKGEALNANDKYSFDHPAINSEEDWIDLKNKMFTDAENLATLIEALPEDKLPEEFFDEKYGNYFRNLHGIIEHTHYHLGQIVLIKKIIQQTEKRN
jgi:hypothetical protein